MAALGEKRHRRAFEPGCSIGMLTRRLAEMCEQVEAMDISPTAVAQAQQRCRHLPAAAIRCGTVANSLPAGTFDLLILSEIGYYFDEDHLRELASTVLERLEPGGTLLASHWLGNSPDHILSGDAVHAVLANVIAAVPGIALAHSERRPGFRLDLWVRA
ncbi:bifunctional 2-polyprenyl-6-hydroxyphenol methylase/3-demethylubiquinol 3-O-methyltransferase UbiG [Acidipila sp. EB88]|uniref:class I SAM-dependent methyltransferase n=1 Tax=Acidipila sp. EB88 TaxID=2305226 RepID=UPI001F3E60AF|nr:class I SAM-dependent methyltransferase [Acidipila sp. EB88]